MDNAKNRCTYFCEGGDVKDQIHSPCNGGMGQWKATRSVWRAEEGTTDFSEAAGRGRDVWLPFSPLQFTYVDSTFLCSYLHYFEKQVFIVCVEK